MGEKISVATKEQASKRNLKWQRVSNEMAEIIHTGETHHQTRRSLMRRYDLDEHRLIACRRDTGPRNSCLARVRLRGNDVKERKGKNESFINSWFKYCPSAHRGRDEICL